MDTKNYKFINERDLFTFFHHHNKQIFPFVLQITDSNELTIEIICDIFNQFRRSKNFLSEIKRPGSYLFRVTIDITFDCLKLRMPKILPSQNFPKQIISMSDAQSVTLAIQQLPPHQQLVYKLSKEEGITPEQIAFQLHLLPETVNAYLDAATNYIRMYLEVEDGKIKTTKQFSAMVSIPDFEPLLKKALLQKLLKTQVKDDYDLAKWDLLIRKSPGYLN